MREREDRKRQYRNEQTNGKTHRETGWSEECKIFLLRKQRYKSLLANGVDRSRYKFAIIGCKFMQKRKDLDEITKIGLDLVEGIILSALHRSRPLKTYWLFFFVFTRCKHPPLALNGIKQELSSTFKRLWVGSLAL